MPLNTGTRLGVYEITTALGAGGMGEVYRARDTQLNRDVAIKVLPEIFALDPDRLARFTREAQTLAALNHPNIAQIHGLEGSGPRALVMELVEGEDLSSVIARGSIPLADALPIARQIAEALEAAHEVGIVHRDLKPANVKVRADGTVKVLDFGLAKALDTTGGFNDGATLTSPAMTHAGVILGTAAYMAPEQARGKSVDRRADIWAFGAVLYEMLTGRRPFDGETMTDALSAIVSRDPDWKALPADASRVVGPLLRRCLEKDVRKRLQSIGEARIILESPAKAEPVEGRAGMRAGVAALLIVGALSAGALGTWALTRSGSRSPVAGRQVTLSLPIGPVPSLTGAFVLSPDGTLLAFVGQRAGINRIFLRPLAQDTATAVPGTEGVALMGPTFSPDGRWLVFHTTGTLKKVPLDGGPTVTLNEGNAGTSSRPAWSPDGTIVFSNATRGLSRIAASGGEVRVVSVVEPKHAELSHEMPWFVTDGTILFNVRRSTAAADTVIVSQNLATGERRELFPGTVLGMVDDDQLIVARNNAVLSIPFDTAALTARGDPRPFVSDILSANRGMFSAVPQFTIARNGTAAFMPSVGGEAIPAMMLVERSGSTTPIAAPPHQYSDPRLSPDGRRIAVHVFEGGRDNWVLDLRSGAFMRLTFDPGEDETPIWSPDGKWIYWTSTRENVNRAIYRKASDGSGAEQLIWSGDRHLHIGGVTPDGLTLVVSLIQQEHTQLGAIRVADGTYTPLVTTPFTNTTPALSHDGRWIAYTSDESGSSEIYVHAFPSMQERRQVSAGGGAEPVWARNGRELYYRGKDKIMSVPFSTTIGFVADAARPLFDDRLGNSQGGGHTGYDATPDGKLVMVSRSSAVEAPAALLKVIYRP